MLLSSNLPDTQLFTLLTSTVGAVMTVVYALDDLVATPLRRHLFDCSNVFRPALAVGAAFWSLLVRIEVEVALLAAVPYSVCGGKLG